MATRAIDWFKRAQIYAFKQLARQMYNTVGALLVDLASSTTVTVSSITTQPGLLPTTASGAGTTHHAVSAASTNATSVKGSAGVVISLSVSNANAAARYLKLYNKASAPTVGSDTPVRTILVPAGNTVVIDNAAGLRFSTGIAYAMTTGIAVADNTGVGLSDLTVSIFYV